MQQRMFFIFSIIKCKFFLLNTYTSRSLVKHCQLLANNVLFIIVGLFLLQHEQLQAQSNSPSSVVAVLQKAGNNRQELEKVISYFTKKKNPLQLKAAYFLISNMDIHHSVNYYWADSSGKRVCYNELDYPNFDSSIRGFEAIKKLTPQIHPIQYKYHDIDSIKATYLIEQIEWAFGAWKQPFAKELTFDDFCEFLLPYRISVEPLQSWRSQYTQRFSWIKDTSGTDVPLAISTLTDNCRKWFTNTYNTEQRKEPLPRLGALQLLHRKKGACEDFASMGVFASRSMGIAASVDYVPNWATSTGSHYFNVAILGNIKNDIPFETLSEKAAINFTIPREPGKVIRITYGKQAGSLALFEAKENIPPSFMRTTNYRDVTRNYWQVTNVVAKLLPKINKPKIVYACVFNAHNWLPIWWGSVQKDSSVFTEMSKGAVYLPMYYLNGKLQPAGYPVAVGYHHTAILKPDSLQMRTIQLPEQERYLKYRPGKKYDLYCWVGYWRLLGTKTTSEHTTVLVFDRVPQNALLLLVPEYSQRKERPFMITQDGERIWW